MAQVTGRELAELNENAMVEQRERAERADHKRGLEIAIADAGQACHDALYRGDMEDARYWSDEQLRLKIALHSI